MSGGVPSALSPASYWRGSTILTVLGAALLVAVLPSTLAAMVDDRTVQGVNTWIKPIKFQLSVGIFTLTIAYFLSWLGPSHRRGAATWFVVGGMAIAGLFEVAYITWQGANGQMSHFNMSSPKTGLLYALMGVGAVTLVFSAFVLGLRLAASNAVPSTALKAGAVWGLLISGALGLVTGGPMSQALSHSVEGNFDPTPIIPFFGWGGTAGDYRASHFFAIHAMHLLPLAALVFPSKAMVRALAVLLTGIIIALFAEAHTGRPFLGWLL